MIVRRERAHPGAQISFTDADGHRFQAILTDRTGANIALIECTEDQIHCDKDTGLPKLPFRESPSTASGWSWSGSPTTWLACAQARRMRL